MRSHYTNSNAWTLAVTSTLPSLRAATPPARRAPYTLDDIVDDDAVHNTVSAALTPALATAVGSGGWFDTVAVVVLNNNTDVVNDSVTVPDADAMAVKPPMMYTPSAPVAWGKAGTGSAVAKRRGSGKALAVRSDQLSILTLYTRTSANTCPDAENPPKTYTVPVLVVGAAAATPLRPPPGMRPVPAVHVPCAVLYSSAVSATGPTVLQPMGSVPGANVAPPTTTIIVPDRAAAAECRCSGMGVKAFQQLVLLPHASDSAPAASVALLPSPPPKAYWVVPTCKVAAQFHAVVGVVALAPAPPLA
eukprot:m.57722 g.57722  ORF g.57722 m.57722 type:complete len:304 (+) comp7784_c0_seq1:294-1205(+)